jgi:Ala-tRNA(Pro) deacylase
MDVCEYLSEEGVNYVADEHPPAYTAQEVAASEHISGDMMAKPVIVYDGGEYVMCVLPASYRLNFDKVSKTLKAIDLRLASEEEMGEIFDDCELGAEPPFGNLYRMDTFVDTHLAEDEEIVFQAGSHRRSVRMRYADYQALAKPKVADLAEHI